MSNTEEFPCRWCGNPYARPADGPEESRGDVCAVCRKLGPRSLVWFQRAIREAETEEDKAQIRQAFAAAKGRSHMTRGIG